MNVRRTSVVLLLCFAFVAQVASAASPNVVISQVYGGGGNAGATYKNDFIELFNRGTSPVNLAGWSVQYASSAGSTWQTTALSGTIAPGQYYLVQEGAGTGGTLSLPTPNASGGIAMSATAGKVALVSATAALTGTCPTANVVDFVGFGGANCFEGTAPTPALSNTTAAHRAGSGCTDTDKNHLDFTTGAAAPRNSSTTGPVCDAGDNAPTITTPASITVNQDAAPFTVAVTGSDDNGIYNWSANTGTGVASVTVTGGQGTANVTYSVTLQAGFSGTASFVATLSDNVNPTVLKTVNITVAPATANDPPSITAFANPVTTVAQDAAPFTVGLSGLDDNAVYAWSAAAGTGVTSVLTTGGQGSANATFTVTLTPGFSGTATFTASLSDNVNAPATAAVTITVTAAPPAPLNHLVISQIYGGGGNSGATYQNDFVELYNPTVASVDLSGWSIQYGSATGSTWQVHPLGGVIGPGEYYLIKLATNGAAGAAVPAANVDGELNLSGTNGKVALVSNGDALSGCTPLDPFLVDLVGYGSTANCREGASNAPTLSNSLAGFRKNGGWTDTNTNGADFVTGTPNPRRTAPIVEIGPSVLSVDPRNNNTTAARDASITVTFTEAVTVESGWYDINCATTGNHNDATVAAGGTNVWIITPNANFTAGEQCTVTIVKNFVHDVDLVDLGANTDTPANNYTFSFNVATGAAPSYSSDVHMTFGNPSGAVPSIWAPNNYLMVKPEFALSYNRDRGTPNWVSWHLADEWTGSLARVDTFRPDPAVPAEWYRVLHTDYFGSGFDRGHMVPNADRDPETSMPINQATFLMSNMIPQAPDNNQGPWANMENYLRTLLPANEVYIIAGGHGAGGTGSSGFMTTFANGRVTVPATTWKVALVLPKASGDDVGRVTADARTIAVVMPNTQGIRNNDWMGYLTTINAVESLTGFDFFANVSDAVENAIEAGVNGNNPPGVEDQEVNADEDEAETFTLNAATPNGAMLTYTIVSGPSHGTLSGSGASRTYTPAPDFNGTDSFTFRVSSGSMTSNTATVTITVYAVNDAPTANDDARSTDEDTPLQFAAYELTSNDVAGPANESNQSLVVNGVSGAVNGSVAFDAGMITFTPAPNFNGAASFSYEVCDGSLCATATVNVTVAAVNDAPVASVSAPPTSVEGATVSASVSVSDADAGDTYDAAWTVTKDGAPFASSNTFTPDDNGTYVVSVTVTDGSGAATTASATITVTNAAPAIGAVSGPTASMSLGTPAAVSVSYTDAGSADTHTATFTWGDNTTSTVSCAAGTCTASRTYAAAGVYGVTIVVTDDDGAIASTSFNSVVVYDVNAGSVTGGGFIAGKANFNVTARYDKGATAPKGNTKFELGGATFTSTSYEWLVISGTTAQLRGTGTVDGAGAYTFVLTATDAPDTFRIQVWDTAGAPVYDSGAAPVMGGSIVIHK